MFCSCILEQFSRPLEKLVTLKYGTTVTMVNAMVEEEVDVEDLLEDDPIDVFDGKLGLALQSNSIYNLII